MALQERIIACSSGPVVHRYLCHYKPKATGADKLSESLLRFKCGHPVDLQAWTACAQASLASILDQHTLLIRALSHQELIVVNPPYTSLDILGSRLAHQCGCRYFPQGLVKQRSTLPLKTLSRDARKKELHQVYTIQYPLVSHSTSAILILDDILTSGTTACAILGALRAAGIRKPISVFTLAYTEKYIPLDDHLNLQSYTSQWDQASGWTQVEESVEYYGAVSRLKQKILDDSF
jgi:predicted amidophosphoribosyltransferase